MNNKNISTRSGILLIAIIAVFVAVLVLKYAENNQTAQVSDNTILKQQPKDQQSQTQEENQNTNINQNPTAVWQTFENNKYGFKIQYPANFLFDENVADLVGELEYNISFGLSYEKVFGESHPRRKSTGIFDIVVYKNKGRIDDFIKKQNAAGAGVEQTSEFIGIDKIAGISVKNIKVCNMDVGENCDKASYFAHNGYIYVIYMHNYFTPESETDKQIFDKMIASFEFLQK